MISTPTIYQPPRRVRRAPLQAAGSPSPVQRPYTPYEYQLLVAASQMQSGQGGSSPLLNGLAAYWKLDETSSVRSDSHSDNHLTDNNTVGAATGKLGNAASFVAANQEYLNAANTQVLQLSTTFTISVWAYLTGYGNSIAPTIVSKRGSTDEYSLDYRTDTTTWRFVFYTSAASYVAEVGATSVLNTWHHLIAWIDGTTAYLQVDNGTPVSVAYTGTLNVGTSDFALVGPPTLNRFFDGRIDEVGIWQRLLTPEERALLYNSGAGRTYPFL